MKLFRLLSTTAIAVAALAISASAMTAEYVPATTTETGKVTLKDITVNANAEQKTLLVLNKNAENVAEGDIVQIDQAATLATVTVGDLVGALDAANNKAIEDYNKTEKTEADYAALTAAWKESATYYVRVGGSGTIETAEFTVNTTVKMPDAEPVAPKYTLGDVNIDTYINMGDADAILNHVTKDKLITDETAKLAADVNIDTYINMGDADAILNHVTKDKLIVQPQ